MAQHHWGTDAAPKVYRRFFGPYALEIIESEHDGRNNFAAFINGKPVWIDERSTKGMTFDVVEQAVFVELKRQAESVLNFVERRGA